MPSIMTATAGPEKIAGGRSWEAVITATSRRGMTGSILARTTGEQTRTITRAQMICQ